MHPFYRLENTVQSYAWGSIDGIPSYTGLINPDGKPMAELWMGAHASGPSVAIHGDERMPLDALIASHPETCLGPDALARFGAELPFLFKVLSAAGPLSLQVHPDREQARIGYARENREAISPQDAKRNYKDANPKREILMALSPFTAMCGFREPAESIRLLSSIRVAALDDCVGRVSATGSRPGYVSLYRTLLELDAKTQKSIIAGATDTARARVSGLCPSPDRTAYELLLSLVELYPTDIGILSPLYLNIVELAPGEALYIPSGIIHSYVRGTGLELMTNSDNTLRCGLTPKHRNVPELYSILEDAPFMPEIMAPDADATIFGYRALFPEFSLLRVSPDVSGHPGETGVELVTGQPAIVLGMSGELVTGQPAIVLGMSGELRMRADGDSMTLTRGISAFVPASVPKLFFSGAGTAYVAIVPEEQSDGNLG